MRTLPGQRSRIGGALLAGAMALALSSCADSSDKPATDNESATDGGLTSSEIYTQGIVSNGDAGEPVEGGVLTVAEYSEARTLSPALGYANGAAGGSALAAVYDTLMRYDFETNAWVPKAAESLESADDITWTLNLRDGVEFSDGTPLDAAAVVASLEYYKANFAYQSSLLLANIKETNVIDDSTVEFVLNDAWATFPSMLAGGPGMIMAPAAYADPEAYEPIGAGPFELDTYSPGEELVLSSRADYWDGAPYLDALRFVFLGADDAKLQSLDSGEVDAAFLRSPQSVVKAREDGYSGMMYVLGMGSQIAINMREGRPGADERVRQAINLAFDNEAYLERTADGAGLPTKHLFAETSPWYADVEIPAVDRDAAAALLDEAKADGYDGKLSYVAGADPVSQAASVQVEAQLEAVGFDVTLDSADNPTDQTRILYVDHEFDIALSATSVGDEDPYSGLSAVLDPMSPTNLSGYTSEDMAAKLAALKPVADSPEDGAAAMTAIEEQWQADVPAVVISAAGNYLPWSDAVHGIVPTTQTMLLYDKAWKSTS